MTRERWVKIADKDAQVLVETVDDRVELDVNDCRAGAYLRLTAIEARGIAAALTAAADEVEA